MITLRSESAQNAPRGASQEVALATEIIEVTGHIVDSLLLAKILDSILDAGCDYEIVDVSIGKTSLDASSARIAVTGEDEVLGGLLDELQVHGANRAAQQDARLVAADQDGVLPAGFYSTTNLASGVRVDGTWLSVENPEMDCGLIVRDGRALTVPMHRVRAGDMVVVGSEGVRVQAPDRARGAQAFEFMASEVSSEKPKALLVARVIQRVREVRARGGKVLVVASTLHAIATGNCLPAGVETFCVDINQAVVTKLADRGSHQALGIVTDVGPFVRQLADGLVGTS